MGQKTNPNIFRLGVVKNNSYRYLEKKSSELALYDFNNIELEKFTLKFFNDNKLNINECKINYSQEGILQIFISYYSKYVPTNVLFNDLNVATPNKNLTYRLFSYIKKIKLLNYSRKVRRKKRILIKKNIRKNYFNSLKNTELSTKKYTSMKEQQSEYLIHLFCDSLSKFLNKKINILVTFQKLNKKLKSNIKKKKAQFLKKKLLKFYRYKENKFFEEGVNTLFTCSQKANSANLLANFLAIQLKKLKRHNFFLRFVKNCLTTFKNSKDSTLKGIKIKIKGRFNRRPRARHRFFKIGKDLPILSIKSKINYSEKTAFTPNGTMGIKVWTF